MGLAEIGTFASVRGVTAYEAGLFRVMRSTQTATSGIGASLRSVNGNIFSGVGGAIAAVGNQIRNVGSLVSSVGFSLSMFSAPLIGAFVGATSAGKQFETQMVKIKNLTGLQVRDFRALREAILDLAPELGVMPTELAEGLYYIGSVGIPNVGDALDILRVSTMAAKAGLGDLGTTSRLITSMMIAFQGEITNASQAADILMAGIKEGGAEAADVVVAIGRGMATWREAGGSAAELMTFIAAYTRLGVTGAVAVTSALNVANFLIDPSQKAEEVLNSVGKSIASVREEVQNKGLIPTLIELEKILGTDIAKLMSVRGTTGAFVLSADAKETLRILKEIENATGSVEAAFNDYRLTSQFAFDSARAALQALGIDLFDAFKKPLSDLLLDLSDLIVKIREVVKNNPELTKLGIQFALATAAAGPLLIILGQVVRALGSIVVMASMPLRLLGFGLGVILKVAGAAFGVLRVGATVALATMGSLAGVVSTASRGMMLFGAASFRAIKPIMAFPGMVRAAGVALQVFATNIAGYVLAGIVGVIRGFNRLSGIVRGIGGAFMSIGREIATVVAVPFRLLSRVLIVLPALFNHAFSAIFVFARALRTAVYYVAAFASLAGAIFPRITAIIFGLASGVRRFAFAVVGSARLLVSMASDVIYGVFVGLPGLLRGIATRIVAIFAGIATRILAPFAGIAARIAGYMSHLALLVASTLATIVRSAGLLLARVAGAIALAMWGIVSVVANLGVFVVGQLTAVVQRIGAVIIPFLTRLIALAYTSALRIIVFVTNLVQVAAMVLGRILASTLVRVVVTAVTTAVSALLSLAGVLATVGGAVLGAVSPILVLGAALAGLILIGAGVAKALSGAFQRVKSSADKQFGGSFAGQMRSHGKNIMQAFSQGIIQGLVAVVRALRSVAQVITRWLRPGSPPKLLPDLDVWGSGALSAYMEGWTKFDFSAFADISSKFRSFFDSLVPAGDEGAGRMAVIERLLDFRKTMVGAINEINATGALGASTWATIANSLSGATDEMKNFVRLTLEAALAQEKVAAAQKRIDDLRKAYDARLKPINDRLAELDRGMAAETDMERTKELERIMRDPRASEEVKRRAQMEIEAIALRGQKGIIEEERDRQLEVLEQDLALAQSEYEAVQQQLEYATQLIDLQIEQNELLREMAEQEKSSREAAAGEDAGGGGDMSAAVPLEEFEGGLDFEGGGGLPKWEGPLGDLDSQLAELKEELGGLKDDAFALFDVLGGRIKDVWENKIKPAIDAFIDHPFTQEVWATIKQTVTDTVENFKRALGPTDDFRAKLDSFRPVVQFLGVVFLALIRGLGRFISMMGAVLGTVVRVLKGLMEPISSILGGIVDLILAVFEYFSTGTDEAKQKIADSLSQIGSGLAGLASRLFWGIVEVVGNFLMAVASGLLEGANRLLLYFEEMTGISTEKARQWIADILEKMRNFATDGGVWAQALRDRVVEKFEDLKEGGKRKIQEMKNGLDWLLTQIKLSFYFTWINLKADVIRIATELKNWIENTFKVDLDKTFADIKKFIEGFATAVGGWINNVKNDFQTALDSAIGNLEAFWNKLKEIWDWLKNNIFKIEIQWDERGNAPGSGGSGNYDNNDNNLPGAGGPGNGGGAQTPPDRDGPATAGFDFGAAPAVPVSPIANQIVIHGSRGVFGFDNKAPVVNFGDTIINSGLDGLELEARIKRIILQMVQ